MKIDILCSDERHPVNLYLERWVQARAGNHQLAVARRRAELLGGDILFLVSCSELIPESLRGQYRATLVLHASDLPVGRGWSPHIWELLGGAEKITVSLLEADDPVDSGRIWKKIAVPIPRDALWDEINDALFCAEIELMDYAVSQYDLIEPVAQSKDISPTYYRRRAPEDSRIDPDQSITEQFDRIRVCDSERYPAYFELHGCRYKLIVEKVDERKNHD
jgi:methionyl-tRNA formyltransferase